MIRCLKMLSVVALGFAAGVAHPADPDEKAILGMLKGEWQVESATRDGKDTGMAGGSVVIGDGEWSLKPAKGKALTARFTLDAAKKPTAITIDSSAAGEGHARGPYRGICEVAGDTLRICHGPPNRVTTEFSDKGQILYTLKRKK
jgi:uncharacterized protein (TIGR03067 family)